MNEGGRVVYQCKNCTSQIDYSVFGGWWCPVCRQTYKPDELPTLKIMALLVDAKGIDITYQDELILHALGVKWEEENK